ncbi:MAG TPA: 23S rRNA (guanosine(2251)-2'-O)-methyltransferase RlmB [Bacillota bacterium]|nr:23S rRNA (guanosine(2251)-2'-O)-methyltransferase RlmB [Bacillota bacterium]
MDEEIIIGRNPVTETLQSGRQVHKVLIANHIDNRSITQLLDLCRKNNIPVERVPKQHIDTQARGNHQGVLAYVKPYSYATLDDLYNRAEEKGELPFFLILDELEDPHNLGAIMRTADATGVHGIIIPKRRAVGLTATVAKTSAGAIEYVPVVQVTNIARTIEELKKNYIWVVGTDAQGTDDYRTLDGETAIALVIGSEGRGISRLVKEKCDWTVSLPMTGAVSSLNASVAASLLMYEIYRKRNPIGET